MKMRQRVKDVAAGALVASLVVGSVPAAFAAVKQVNIPVNYNNIKVVVDGQNLATSNEPFIYNGTTYLPVRAVSEAVGKKVTWDGNTNTVYLGEVPASTGQSAYSRTNPAPIGTAQTYRVDDYSEKYTANVQILSVERGDAAWSKIKEANMFNDEPESGKEYILAKVKIAVSNVQDDKAVSVSGYMFDAFSGSNVEYDLPSIVEPEPEFYGDIYSGSSKEGYIAFEVDKSDTAPKAVFGRKYDGTGGIWFKLY